MDTPGSEGQIENLDHLLGGWLDAIDEELAKTDTPLPERPFQALLRLITSEMVQIQVGEQEIDAGRPWDHVAEPWFRALYVAVEGWYRKNYGVENIRGKGVPPLEGVILIRGAPFALQVPANRSKVHKEGREAWLYFEQGLGEGEDPVRWLKEPPDLSTLEAVRRLEIEASVSKVAGALRSVHFHRMGVTQNPAAEGLADAAKGYLQSAARRIRTCKAEELGPAWFDLQMAMESALKLVLQMATGTYPYTHVLTDLLIKASTYGVVFDVNRLKLWPDFKTMSDYRYAQGDPGGLARLFKAYLLALDLVAAAMTTIKTPLQSGAGFLLRRPPWLLDDAEADEEPDDSSAEENMTGNHGKR